MNEPRPVSNCARCGGDHLLWFKKLERPIQFQGGRKWEYWCECPQTGDPILIEVKPQKGDTYDVFPNPLVAFRVWVKRVLKARKLH